MGRKMCFIIGGGYIMQWSIRNLLNPVITRCLIYDISPFDLEYVLRKVEEKPLLNGKMLENTWMSEWKQKADYFKELAEGAQKRNMKYSVSQYYQLAARCYYACYLLNSDVVEAKKKIYDDFSFAYRQYVMNSDERVEEVRIPMGDDNFLPGYLHFPNENKFHGPYPCVVIYVGMGSCKEEVEVEARAMVNRGMAVLTIDMPGTGAALFHNGLKLHGDLIEQAFDEIMKFLKEHTDIDDERLGTFGLCMGGGIAYRAAAKYPSIKACVNLFPLFVSMVNLDSIPRWMRDGLWADYQIGYPDKNEWIETMRTLEKDNVKGRYLLVHSEFDNWMEIEKTKYIYDKTTGQKQEIVVKQKPVYATEESVMHAMPVGEQMQWVKIQAADFLAETFQLV